MASQRAPRRGPAQRVADGRARHRIGRPARPVHRRASHQSVSGRPSTTPDTQHADPAGGPAHKQGFFDPAQRRRRSPRWRFRHRRRLPRPRSPKPRRPALGRSRRVPIRARKRRNRPHPAEARIGRCGIGVSATARARVRRPRTTASSRRRCDALSPRAPASAAGPLRRPSTATASGSLSARWAPPRVDRGERSRVREKPEYLRGEAVESRLLALTLRPQPASRPARRRGSRRGRDRRSRARARVDRVPRERPPDAGGRWSDGDRSGGLSHPAKPSTGGRSGCPRSCSESRGSRQPRRIGREASASRQASVAARSRRRGNRQVRPGAECGFSTHKRSHRVDGPLPYARKRERVVRPRSLGAARGHPAVRPDRMRRGRGWREVCGCGGWAGGFGHVRALPGTGDRGRLGDQRAEQSRHHGDAKRGDERRGERELEVGCMVRPAAWTVPAARR